MIKNIHVVLFALVVSACVTPGDAPPRFCESSSLVVDANFDGGNFYACTITNDTDVSVTIRPEDEPPINQSPWYALRVSPFQATSAKVTISFEDGYPRYWPKTSTDGVHFAPATDDQVVISEDGNFLEVTVPLDHRPVWISAQPLVLPTYYDSWLREMDAKDDVATSILGRSVEGRPIAMASTPSRDEAVFLFGRQHPPEVSGAMAMRSFVNTVLGESDLARTFRERFTVYIIPLINPDGVVAGHWRHNMNGIDLNRDWGPFTQPETQSIARLLSKLEQDDVSFKLMLDFHSTRESLFYTQLATDFDEPVDFATAWLNNSRDRLGDFPFKHDPRGPSGQDNTKNYFFGRYAIPAVTYEIGDEVPKDIIEATTPVFAEEMMRELLSRP